MMSLTAFCGKKIFIAYFALYWASKAFYILESASLDSNFESVLTQPDLCCHRFEPDMLAFSGCYYGGGDKEKKDLGAIRRRWKTLHVKLNYSPLEFL